MTLWAGSSRTLKGPVTPHVATSEILSMRYGFQMVGPHTQTIAAQVVELQPLRDRTNHQFVDRSVREVRAVLPANLTVAIR
jgi:hypothetical protein